MEDLVDLNSVSVDLGGQSILHGVNLAIAQGTAIGVIGPNGSGKTTLLRLIATLIRPSSGDGHILGHRLGTPAVRLARSEIGLISHHPALIEELSLGENLRHFGRLTGTPGESLNKAMEVVGLERAANRRAGDASFGMKRRLESAWLLVAHPRLLLLDEAKSGLDQDAQELIDALVNLTIERGGSVVSVSHDHEHLAGTHFVSRYRIAAGQLEVAT